MLTGFVPAGNMLGTVLAGKYVLTSVIGEGGMGTVFEAAHSALGRSVAIKVMHPHLATSPEHVQRFHHEAIAGGRFSHVNSVGVLDYDRTRSGHPFLVMELVRGTTLVQYAYDHGPLPLEQVVELVEQLLSGLDAAHAAGVVHCDVKSDNILVQPGENGPCVKLIDYGIAAVDGIPTQPQRAGGPMQLSGTPDFMAPEVIAGHYPTFASDLYAAGVVLYELLTETRPFTGQPYQEILRQHVSMAVAPPSQLRPDRNISPALEQVVLCALAKSPGDRFSSAGTFAHALRRALLAKPPAPIAIPTPAPRPLARGTDHPPAAGSTQALHQQIASALRRGVVDDIAAAYFDLATSLKDRGCFATAAMELAEAIDIVTAGSSSSLGCVELLRKELMVVRELSARSIKREHVRYVPRSAVRT